MSVTKMLNTKNRSNLTTEQKDRREKDRKVSNRRRNGSQNKRNAYQSHIDSEA